jgi:hypothetical protein
MELSWPARSQGTLLTNQGKLVASQGVRELSGPAGESQGTLLTDRGSQETLLASQGSQGTLLGEPGNSFDQPEGVRELSWPEVFDLYQHMILGQTWGTELDNDNTKPLKKEILVLLAKIFEFSINFPSTT